jgi:hypothetical protein
MEEGATTRSARSTQRAVARNRGVKAYVKTQLIPKVAVAQAAMGQETLFELEVIV